jgi:hypothetical protein
MSIPRGVASVEVACLPGSVSSPIVRVKVQVTPNVSAKWQTTGQSLASMCNESPLPGFVMLPAVDQSGFVNDVGSGVTNWSYNVITDYTLSDGTVGQETGTIRVFAYQSPEVVWLNTAGGEFVAPQTYPIGGLAVNGWVETYADLPADLDLSDAGKSYMVQADQRMYIWSGAAWPPNGQGFAATGPQGPTGATGATGPANTLSVGTVQTGSPIAITISGTAPNQTIDFTLPEGHWWTGAGNPGTISAALNGDLYLDNTGTGNVWQLQSGTWVSQGSLLGPTGPTGATGPANSLSIGTVTSGASPSATITGTAPNQVLNLVMQQGATGATGASTTWRQGSGAPAAGLGNNGDMYLNGANGDVYGPKASGAWGSPVANIVGPSAPQATASTQGTIQLGGGDLGGTATAVTVPGLANKANTTTTITAGTGLTGGGDLSANRTLAVSYGTTAGTAAQGNDTRITGAVQSTRQVIAGTGLSGGGDLSADRTLAVSYGTTAGTAAQGNDSRITGAVQTTRQVIAGTGLTGGGDLSADRTLTVAYGTTSTTACVGNDSRLSNTRTPSSNTVPCDFMYVAVGPSTARAIGNGDWTVDMYVGRAFTATSAVYQFETADASGSTSATIRRNGTAVTNAGVTVTAANQADGSSTDSARTATFSQSFAVGDRFGVNITAVGTTPGKGLKVWIFGTWN